MTVDAKPRKPTRLDRRKIRMAARERWLRVRKAERQFAAALRSVATQVGHLVRVYAPNGIVGDNLTALKANLDAYSQMLHPWAKAVVARLHKEVDAREEQAWIQLGQESGRALKKELAGAPTGAALKAQMYDQVGLIQSIPSGAAERVHKIAMEMLSSGDRYTELQKEIMRTEHVTKSRAELIARTETSRASVTLTEVRAKHIGSEGYTWRTSLDSDVRKDHKILEGTFHKWTEPPIADTASGARSHPGAIFNCRCWAEPALPDVIA